ncbi:family 43 glycosylhydrolase [Gilvimarinus xylanilyticus]|uniref:Family 43 glycosylhydrolase n=1 Tax=Gilvimarinus xylanilyticus TaxID=2944139 RepID=A0A9X2HT70_9GAMM|nr:family 43 glycosylhydrolase [Gilvimarinus xylanilyticus]MCP8898083.1 family 43 glycosylhydrolase [Gilvimarinus xylanilyticus]
MPSSLKRTLGASLIGLLGATSALADNPAITERFSADPAAIVHDGKVYLYVGHDEAATDGDFFVLREWNIYSSTDLENWTLEGEVPRTIFEWAEADSAWASQAVEHDGKFYWYTTVRGVDPEDELGGYTLGVAVSDDPVTGWKDALGKPMLNPNETDPAPHMIEHSHSWDDIDPSVFIDDDGEAYLYWGNSHLYYAKLADNMIEFDGEIHKVDIQNMPGTFTEAPWVHEKNGTYYLTFAMNYPEELAYATSDSPTGPWEFQAVIMDTLEDSGTSHQAILEFEGDDYFIYHTAALPTGGNFRRSVSIEHLNYNPDGSIQKITPTASGITHAAQALQSVADTDEYMRYDDDASVAMDELNADDRWNFQWHLAALVEGDNTVSFQPETRMGYYLSNRDGELSIQRHDGTDAFARSATFTQVDGLAGHGSSYRLLDDSSVYLMTDGDSLTLGKPGTNAERKAASFMAMPVE